MSGYLHRPVPDAAPVGQPSLFGDRETRAAYRPHLHRMDEPGCPQCAQRRARIGGAA